MLIEPADGADQLLLPAVPPELQLVSGVAMHAELRRLAALYPLRPGITEQAVHQQAELVRLWRRQGEFDPLASIAVLREHDFIFSRRHIRMDSSAGSRASGDGDKVLVQDFDLDAGKCDIAMVADVANEHERKRVRGRGGGR
jgi:hypothetical protein